MATLVQRDLRGGIEREHDSFLLVPAPQRRSSSNGVLCGVESPQLQGNKPK